MNLISTFDNEFQIDKFSKDKVENLSIGYNFISNDINNYYKLFPKRPEISSLYNSKYIGIYIRLVAVKYVKLTLHYYPQHLFRILDEIGIHSSWKDFFLKLLIGNGRIFLFEIMSKKLPYYSDYKYK